MASSGEVPTINGRPYIGGQAVLEGVMMRAPSSFAVVVRRSDGSLVVRERPMTDTRGRFAKLPFVRGVTSLVESLRLGSEALRFSADQMEKDFEAQEEEERRQKREALAAKRAAAANANGAEKKASAITNILSALGVTLFLLATNEGDMPAETTEKKGKGPMSFMLVIAILFFIALPQGVAAGINRWLHLGLEVQSPAFQALTGVFKLTIVIGYLVMIRRVPDIRRVFQYHGAEHKTISTYEAGEELVVANARAKTTLHPRCGTTFLVMVALVSIVMFTAVGGFLPRIQTGSVLLDNVIFFFEKLPFLPLLAAVTFELQRLFARYCTTGPMRALLWPGFLVQKITTIEPDDAQLEVALASLRATLFRERGEVTANADGSEATGDVAFASYESLAAARVLR